jgi:hypothetical protein
MKELFIVTILYFIIGCAAMLFSMWPKNNKFIQFLIKNFDNSNMFNKFLLYVWLYPIVVATLLLMILNAFN